MKKIICLIFLLLVLFSLPAVESIYSVTSGFSESDREAVLRGETLQYGSPDGYYVPSIAFDGTRGKEKAALDEDTEGCFVMGVTSFLPYPERWKEMTLEERRLELINTLLSVSTIKGITYLSYTTGADKVLFSDAYTLTSSEKGKKAYDVEFTYAPREYEYEIAAYLKDNFFGGNVYIISYEIYEDEIFVTFTNKDKLKFLFFTAVDSGELNMSVDVLMTEEGFALFGMATVFREDTRIKTPFVTVDLPSAFSKRIVSLKNWFVGEIEK